jgi:hypothetical protein
LKQIKKLWLILKILPTNKHAYTFFLEFKNMHITIVTCPDIVENTNTMVLILEPDNSAEADRNLVIKDALDKHDISYGIYDIEGEIYYLSSLEESTLNNDMGETNSILPPPNFIILGIPLTLINAVPDLDLQSEIASGKVTVLNPK